MEFHGNKAVKIYLHSQLSLVSCVACEFVFLASGAVRGRGRPFAAWARLIFSAPDLSVLPGPAR